MTIIAPSLLAADFSRLGAELERAEQAGADWHHVDVMDGHFVPNLTIGPVVVESLAKVATKPLDVHLMIEDPWTYADPFLDAGAAGLTFHAELEGRGDLGALIKHIKGRGKRVAMAINPATPVTPLESYLDRLDMVLVMSVVPGFGGQKFTESVLEKVRDLRERCAFEGDIQMDGGIHRDNVARCAEAGCNVFVAGTALFGAPDMTQEVRLFRERIAACRSGV